MSYKSSTIHERNSVKMRAVSCLLVAVQCHSILTSVIPNEYEVPKPTIEVFSPKGFRVSIPHEEGIHLFAFHGNINRPMEGLEAGQFSKDILKRKGDRWVFEDRRTKLARGDVIYYWLFVIRYDLGYRYDDGEFRVQDILTEPQKEHEEDNHPHQSPNGHTNTNQFHFDDTKKPVERDSMCDILANFTTAVNYLKSDLKIQREVNDILKKIIGKHQEAAKTLKFSGVLPPEEEAGYVAQIIVSEKLGAHVNIVNATWNDDRTITFRVSSLEDKLFLIQTAKEKLEKINSKIKLTF